MSSTVKYRAAVEPFGEMAPAFAAEGIVIFFGLEAPEELHDFAILIDHKELLSPVTPGDVIEIDGVGLSVVGVGDVANENLSNLGHLVVKFNGLEEPELPGDVSVAAQPVPDINIGTVVRILEGIS